MNRVQLLASILFFLIISVAQGQDSKSKHQLLWRISAPHLDHDSYIYGTMHLADSRVFNFSDSLYLRIEECKNFALEVHPDTMIKYLVVDPFNSQINKGFEELIEDDELEELNEELKEKTGLDLINISEENKDLIPLALENSFKKNKDKNTFLDAHLYHIARILEKNIIGLESIDDHKETLNKLSNEEYDFEARIKNSLLESKLIDPFIEVYERGDIEEIYEFTSFTDNGILIQRNKVMVNTATEYINDGGLFMAVGAAHLGGEEGMINLLKEKGYKLEVVDVSFSQGLIHAEWADKDLEWVREKYTDEGFSLMLPDKSFTYLPASMSGIVKVRSYPDLGTGHFYFFSVLPVLADQYSPRWSS